MTTPAPNTILHLGLGSFHRAHQAAYLHRLRQIDPGWAIVAGNIRPDMAEVIDALAMQRGEYTLETVSPTGERRYDRIRSIVDVIPFDETHARLLDTGAQDSTRIISFTVTEAGYCLAADDRLDLSYPELRADVEAGSTNTVYGIVAAMLRLRMKRQGRPVTLLSCDNLRSNGHRFRAGLLDFLQRRGETALHAWVGSNTSCPCAMVDRITPRPPPDLPQRVAAATGWPDAAPVTSETFTQWVIEDHFMAGRPAWEQVGVEMVGSVHDHEEAKIRLLNATHGCIAWAGALLGLSHIHEGMQNPAIRRMARDYTDEAIACLDPGDRENPIDLVRYRDTVLDRFSNPFVPDTNQRVAAEGATKVSAFILPTIRDRLSRNQGLRGVARLPALFLAVLERWHRGALPFPYLDQAITPDALHALCAAADPLAAFAQERILWQELTGHAQLHQALIQAREDVACFAG